MLKLPDQWPNVPSYLYIGPDKVARFKVYATPPENPDAEWVHPYSIRSFVSQASQQFGGCFFTCSRRGMVLGQPAFRDRCAIWKSEDDDRAEENDCHLIAGWGTGETTCPLWERIASLCQTEHEKSFLYHYLRFVKDRQFPMLIPQARIGIAERRRPDFVAFIPLQHWNYIWMAIELDGAHGSANVQSDEARNAELLSHGYTVFSVRPAEKGYLEEVRRLVERIETHMALADSDAWAVAVEAPVRKVVLQDDLPF